MLYTITQNLYVFFSDKFKKILDENFGSKDKRLIEIRSNPRIGTVWMYWRGDTKRLFRVMGFDERNNTFIHEGICQTETIMPSTWSYCMLQVEQIPLRVGFSTVEIDPWLSPYEPTQFNRHPHKYLALDILLGNTKIDYKSVALLMRDDSVIVRMALKIRCGFVQKNSTPPNKFDLDEDQINRLRLEECPAWMDLPTLFRALEWAIENDERTIEDYYTQKISREG